MAGKSIFSHEQDNGTDSILGNWYQELLDKQAEELKKKNENLNRYDYLPIVKINHSEEPKHAIISIKE